MENYLCKKSGEEVETGFKKKKMNKLLVILTVILVVQVNVDAQRERRGQMDPYQDSTYVVMVDSMQLDEEQKLQFDALQKKFQKDTRTKMRAARESGVERSAMRKEMKTAAEGHQIVLANILTQEQMAIYNSFMKRRQQERQARQARRGRRGGN